MKELRELIGKIWEEKFPTSWKQRMEEWVEENKIAPEDDNILEIEDPRGPTIELE